MNNLVVLKTEETRESLHLKNTKMFGDRREH